MIFEVAVNKILTFKNKHKQKSINWIVSSKVHIYDLSMGISNE